MCRYIRLHEKRSSRRREREPTMRAPLHFSPRLQQQERHGNIMRDLSHLTRGEGPRTPVKRELFYFPSTRSLLPRRYIQWANYISRRRPPFFFANHLLYLLLYILMRSFIYYTIASPYNRKSAKFAACVNEKSDLMQWESLCT